MVQPGFGCAARRRMTLRRPAVQKMKSRYSATHRNWHPDCLTRRNDTPDWSMEGAQGFRCVLAQHWLAVPEDVRKDASTVGIRTPCALALSSEGQEEQRQFQLAAWLYSNVSHASRRRATCRCSQRGSSGATSHTWRVSSHRWNLERSSRFDTTCRRHASGNWLW